MNEPKQKTIAIYDKPIQRPSEEIPEEFLRRIEARFTTKRFPKPTDTRPGRERSKQKRGN